uniref:Chitin-binding type-2 domain-containing protein n=1 Tax=Anopheles coluzzii TaxID=1518534 RepID=A0A8W7P7F3_ANOCL
MRQFLALVLSVLGMALVDATCILDARCPLVEDANKPTHLSHSDCKKFSICSYGQACEKSCPEGQHWSTALQRCEWPNVACCDPSVACDPTLANPTVVPEATTIDTPVASLCTADARCPLYEDQNNPTHLSHESNCAQFYTCSYGRRCLKQCPTGLHFSVLLQRCEHPSVACCDPSTVCQSLATTSMIPTTAATVVCQPDARCPLVETNPLAPLLLPVPGNCGAFYKCRTGDACLLACPAGQHFSQTLQLCERPSVACCDPSVPC